MPGSILFPTEVSMYDTEKAFYRHYEYIQKENSLYSRWFQKRGLSYPQFLILDAVLRRPEGAEPTALAEECFMPKQTVTGLLDQLERAGFIRRERCRDGQAADAGFLSACGRRFRDRHYGRAGSSRTGCARFHLG